MARNKSVAHALMNRGSSYERQIGRMLSRGRVRGMNADLEMAINTADKIIKDFGAAAPAGAVQGADVYNPTPASPKRKSRLSLPHD